MNKEIELLNKLKQYFQHELKLGFDELVYNEDYQIFKVIDVISTIDNLQHQLEEKQKDIDEAIGFINTIKNEAYQGDIIYISKIALERLESENNNEK